jgi:large subunit ribosomal protein L4
MKAKVFSQDGKAAGEMDLSDSVFGVDVNEHLMYLVVKSLRANQRQGTSKTKTRDEVSGGGKKPWKQKHTGNARAGSNALGARQQGARAQAAGLLYHHSQGNETQCAQERAVVQGKGRENHYRQ